MDGKDLLRPGNTCAMEENRAEIWQHCLVYRSRTLRKGGGGGGSEVFTQQDRITLCVKFLLAWSKLFFAISLGGGGGGSKFAFLAVKVRISHAAILLWPEPTPTVWLWLGPKKSRLRDGSDFAILPPFTPNFFSSIFSF